MSDQERKPDRRIARTKKLLFDALMELIKEKSFADITLEDITKRADVARTTFYLHYKDKDELLFDGTRAMYDELLERYKHQPALAPGAPDPFLDDASDFEHVARYADFYQVMLGPNGSQKFLVRVLNYLATLFHPNISRLLFPKKETFRVPAELAAYFMAGAEIGVMTWWLQQNKMQYTPAEMARMTNLMCIFGMNWGGGLDHPQPDAEQSASQPAGQP
ncbi:MAG: TetR/AcrR family transcriptional regulator [Anaerolineae bacterium]|nr:TetR/AcrR family transcriptional regulator [Anaerolineae bacterium]